MVITYIIYLYLLKFFIGIQIHFIHEDKLTFVKVHDKNVFVAESIQNLQQLFSVLLHAQVHTYPSMTWSPVFFPPSINIWKEVFFP